MRSAVVLCVCSMIACSSSDAPFTLKSGSGGAVAGAGCTKDTDCKGTRICVDGQCTMPDASGVPSAGGGGAQGAGGASQGGAGAISPGGQEATAGGGSAMGGAAGGGGVSRDSGAATGGSAGNGGVATGGGSGSSGSTADGGADAGYGPCPLALVIMQDRSSSMISMGGSPDNWFNSKTAVTEFVNDPKSQGIGMGLAVFPPMQPPNTTAQGDCAAGSDCGSFLVPIAKLPGNASTIIGAYDTAQPDTQSVLLTPTECALRGLINDCLVYTANTGERCVGIFVTDGSPTTCDTNPTDLANIVAAGYGEGVVMYVLGLPGSDPTFLNQLATVGGTAQSINVSGGPTAISDALHAIRATYCP